ncbi:hypothetical protein B7494_g721 [Chlorociboria aeruginascens]|nr:hypothetical protein B7494_g721 [Chlorociboria aeruginascens]
MPTLSEIFVTFSLGYLLYLISRCIYNIYFHPLSSIPGPKLWAASRISLAYHRLRGDLPYRIKELHDTYGREVRVAPQMIDYDCASAWEDIYGFVKPNGKSQNFPKNLKDRGAPSETVDIINANDLDHRRIRRLLNHAFSSQALTAQETLIQDYSLQFINGLRSISSQSPSGIVPLSTWYNLATFDLIGDLAFGESFHGVKTGILDPWIKNIISALVLIVWTGEISFYPILMPFLMWKMPKKERESFKRHKKLAAAKAERRMEAHNTGEMRSDFMSYILKHNGTEKGMSKQEIKDNARIFIIAGSETTATLLTGLTYHLLLNPDKLHLLTHEIRSSFTTSSSITLHKLGEMKYLGACIEEGLRMYPPVPATFFRLIPPGGDKTSVGVNFWAASYSARNFHDPNNFYPERWLSSSDDPSSPFYNDDKKARQPFSYGPRNCIGINLAYAEMRILLARLVWEFDLVRAKSMDHWMENNFQYIVWKKPVLEAGLQRRGDLPVGE